MVRTTRTRTTAALAAAALAGGLTLAALTLLGGAPATAQTDASTAYGISASGVDPVGAQPSVSSDGAVVSDSAGGVAGGLDTFAASGLTVKAGAGIAEASVSDVAVNGHSIGAVSATCTDGVVSYTGGGPEAPAENLRVSYRNGAGAVITILGADGNASQTITVAVASCGKGGGGEPTTTPPVTTTEPTETTLPVTTTTEPTTTTSTGEPTTSTPTSSPTSSSPTPKPEQPLPAPQPRDGHIAVTG